jgi:hypothetical protein
MYVCVHMYACIHAHAHACIVAEIQGIKKHSINEAQFRHFNQAPYFRFVFGGGDTRHFEVEVHKIQDSRTLV